MRLRRHVFAGTVLLVGLLLGLAAPASATSGACAYTCAGSATFNSNGQILKVIDNNPYDGRSVVVPNRRWDMGGGWYYGWSTAGGTRPYDLTIPYPYTIDYYVCLSYPSSGQIDWGTCGPMVLGDR
jgi:hypothetical protein